MSPTSIGGGYRFGFLAASLSPASLKRSSCNKIFLQSKNFILDRCVIKNESQEVSNSDETLNKR
jgi:hypothetical protein